MLLMILVIVALLALCGGAWAQPQYGYASWSPVGLLLLIIVVLFLAGYLHT